MGRLTKGAALACATVMLMSPTVSVGETVTYTGTGTYEVMRAVLPLANGGAAIHLSHNIVATINPSESGFIYGDCAGLGYLTVEGRYSGSLYCTFTETGDDSFDLKAVTRDDSGSVKRKYSAGTRGSYEYEFNITTP